MDKILTIGIPSYNAEKTLNGCLDSFIQTGIIEDIQIIVVNDGSNDGTSEIGHTYEERYPDSILVVDKENGGHGSGINTAVKYAIGKYIKIVDSDDTVDCDGFINLVKELKKISVDLVLSPYYIVRDNKKQFVSYYGDDAAINRQQIILDNTNKNIKFAMHSMTYRTQILKDSKYKIDEHCFYVDVEYSIFYLVGVKNVLLLTEPVYCYSVGSENQSVNIKNMQKNIKQHTHVCKSLITFYEDVTRDLQDFSLVTLIRENIINMILITEYRIIFSLPNVKESKDVLIEIEEFTKNNSKIIYEELINVGKRRKLKIISLLILFRKINYVGYPFIRRILWSKLREF